MMVKTPMTMTLTSTWLCLTGRNWSLLVKAPKVVTVSPLFQNVQTLSSEDVRENDVAFEYLTLGIVR